MGRGAHAAHAAYNGSGTQGLAVTNKINENEEIKSVFLTENDTTKQIVHGCNISEMTCSGKIESVNSERYKIFTPDENSDMLGDIYLNFEMDSEINEFTFVDESSSNTEYDMYSFTEQSRTLDLELAGSELKSLVVDLNTDQIPSVIDKENLDVLGFEVIHQTKIVETDKAVYQFIVGKGDSSSNSCNIAWREYGTNNWQKLLFSKLKEVNCVIVEPHAHSGGIAIFGGVPRSIESMTATAAATITDGSVTGITHTLPFAGAYTSPPIVTISAPEGEGGITATAVVPVINQGFFGGGIIVTNGGSGYTSVPTVTIAPPPGYNPLFFLYMNYIKDSGSTITDLSFNTFPNFPLNNSGGVYYKTIYSLNYYGERPKDSTDFGNIIVSGANTNALDKTNVIITSNRSNTLFTFEKVELVGHSMDVAVSSSFSNEGGESFISLSDKSEILLGIDSNGKLIRSYDNGKNWKNVETFYHGPGDGGYYQDDNFNYYIPLLDYVVSDNSGKWIAIGKQGLQGEEVDENKKFRQFVFISEDDGVSWAPVLLEKYGHIWPGEYGLGSLLDFRSFYKEIVEYLQPHLIQSNGIIEIPFKVSAGVFDTLDSAYSHSVIIPATIPFASGEGFWAFMPGIFQFPEVTGAFDYEYIGVANDRKLRIYYGSNTNKGVITCTKTEEWDYENGWYGLEPSETRTTLFNGIYPRSIKYAYRDLLIGVFSNINEVPIQYEHVYRFKKSFDGITWDDITINETDTISSTEDPLIEGDKYGNFIVAVFGINLYNLYRYNNTSSNFEIILDNTFAINNVYDINFVSNEWQIAVKIGQTEYLLKSYDLVNWQKIENNFEGYIVRKISYKPERTHNIIYKTSPVIEPYKYTDIISYEVVQFGRRESRGGVFPYKAEGVYVNEADNGVKYFNINNEQTSSSDRSSNQGANDIIHVNNKVFLACNKKPHIQTEFWENDQVGQIEKVDVTYGGSGYDVGDLLYLLPTADGHLVSKDSTVPATVRVKEINGDGKIEKVDVMYAGREVWTFGEPDVVSGPGTSGKGARLDVKEINFGSRLGSVTSIYIEDGYMYGWDINYVEGDRELFYPKWALDDYANPIGNHPGVLLEYATIRNYTVAKINIVKDDSIPDNNYNILLGDKLYPGGRTTGNFQGMFEVAGLDFIGPRGSVVTTRGATTSPPPVPQAPYNSFGFSLVESESSSTFRESETIYGNTASGKIPVTSFADNLRRLYSSPRNPEIIFTVGDFFDTNINQTYGVILYRTTASSDIYDFNINDSYYWRVLMGPPLTSYDPSLYVNNKGWIVSDFKNITDVALSKTRPEMVVVGEAKSDYNLVIFKNASTNDFRDYTVQKLNFEIIYTVTNLGNLWIVGGKPSQSDEWNNQEPGAVFNNKCVAYTFDLENWKYIDFTDGADVPNVTMPGSPFFTVANQGTTTSLTDSINFEANDIKPLDVYGQTGILLQISFNYNIDINLDVFNRSTSGYVGEKIYFMYVSGETLTIEQNNSYPEPRNLLTNHLHDPPNRKQLVPSFTTIINNIERRFVASEHPNKFNSFIVDYYEDSKFKLTTYINNYLQNSRSSKLGFFNANPHRLPLNKFKKFINIYENSIIKRSNGHCYKIARVKNENFVTGVNSARYVAVGKGNFSNILWSDDLLFWNDTDTSGIFDIAFDVTHKHGLWVATGTGNYQVAISKDGKKWTGVYPKYNDNLPEIITEGVSFTSLDHYDPWQAASVATAEAFINPGFQTLRPEEIYITKSGSGYLSAPVVTVRDNVSRTVSGTTLISNGSVTSINISPNYTWMNSDGTVSTDYTEYPPFVVTIAPPTITNNIADVLPYIPTLKGIFLRNLSILRLFNRIEYQVGTQIWQTLTFDDIKAMLDTEFGAGEYAKLLKNCSTVNKNGSTKLTTWIPGFTKTLNSKLENFHNVSESGSFPSGLLKDQKLSIKIYYNKLENIIGNELTSSDMNNAVFDNFMNNTLIPCDRDPNYFIDSFLADNYGFQLGDNYQNVNGYFKLKFSTDIQRLRLYCKQFELDDTEINEFNKGVKQVPKITQSLYFDADNTKNMLLDLDNFNMYASHIIVSGWLTSEICITDMNLELNGYSYNKTFEPSAIDFATKLCLGLNYNRYTFNGVDKEDGIGSLVIPLASTAYSGSSVPLDRYSSIRLRINFNANAGPRSYINVTCVGTTTVSYNNSTANIDIF